MKPCADCPWTKRGMPLVGEREKEAARGGSWFCCHVNLGTCYGAQNWARARKELVALLHDHGLEGQLQCELDLDYRATRLIQLGPA